MVLFTTSLGQPCVFVDFAVDFLVGTTVTRHTVLVSISTRLPSGDLDLELVNYNVSKMADFGENDWHLFKKTVRSCPIPVFLRF